MCIELLTATRTKVKHKKMKTTSCYLFKVLKTYGQGEVIFCMYICMHGYQSLGGKAITNFNSTDTGHFTAVSQCSISVYMQTYEPAANRVFVQRMSRAKDIITCNTILSSYQNVWVPFSGNTYTKRMGAVLLKHFGRKTRTVSIPYKLSKKCSRLERYNRSCRVRIEISNIYRTIFSSKVSSYNRTCRI